MVTGATGMIGAALTRTLLDMGCRVTVLVRNPNRVPSIFAVSHSDQLRIVTGDLSDGSALAHATATVDAIFHAAAHVHSVPRTEAAKAEFFKINVKGTENLLHSIQGHKVRSFVFFSTIAVFGESSSVLNEAIAPNPVSPYAISKYLAEQAILEAANSRGFLPTVLRLSLVYGPGDRGNFQRMIKAVDRGRFLLIGRGKILKSLTHVDNVVEAALLAAGRSRETSHTYVISDPQAHTLRQIASVIAKELGRSSPGVEVPASMVNIGAWALASAERILRLKLPITARDVKVLLSNVVCDTRLAQTQLGFRATTQFEQGIAMTVRDYRRSSQSLSMDSVEQFGKPIEEKGTIHPSSH
jgi:UDP-glucose 4-epimerase